MPFDASNSKTKSAMSSSRGSTKLRYGLDGPDTSPDAPRLSPSSLTLQSGRGRLRFQCAGNGRELLEGIFEVVNDLLRQQIRVGQRAAVFDAFVLDPEQIEAQLVSL